VELFNEPILGGLLNHMDAAFTARRLLFDFHAAVLASLDKELPQTRCPIALQDLFGSLPDASAVMKLLYATGPLSCFAKRHIKAWAARSQLIVAFHYYPGIAASVEFPEMVKLAHEQASRFAGKPGMVPVFLSEFHEGAAEAAASRLVQSVELGCNAVTYWHYVDTEWTGQLGWYKYPPAVLQAGTGVPVNDAGKIDPEAWEAYKQTVADGTFWGANITGANGGSDKVLQLMSNTSKRVHEEEATHPHWRIHLK